MNTATTHDTAEIETALATLLRAIVEHDANRAPAPLEVIFAAPFDSKPIPTRRQSEVNALLADPIRAALRQGVRRLGEVLFEMGRTGLMAEVAETVANMSLKQGSRHASIIDYAWDGIGEGDDRWWA